jgi:hypothetical protein
MKYHTDIILALSLLFFPLVQYTASAQQQDIEKENEKKLETYIETETERLTDLLHLEDWQVFYVDSTLNNDYHAMQGELKKLSDAKVTNYDLYRSVQDKWMEKIYNSYHKFLNDAQWKKYLKSGAAREKKVRDRRKAKIEKDNNKINNR